MKAKRFVSIICALIVLIGGCSVLVGCNEPTYIPDELKIEIMMLERSASHSDREIDLNEWNKLHIAYGMFHGYAVYFTEGAMDIKTTKIIAGYTFYHSCYFAIWCYKDAYKIELEDAYEQGIMSEKDVRIIWERYTELGTSIFDRYYPKAG